MNNYKDDLTATVHELSHAYEELSLLYRVAGMFASLSIDDICSRMVDEAMNTIGVKTAAVLFLDDRTGVLSTKISRGSWDNARTFDRDAEVLWKTIRTRRQANQCVASSPASTNGNVFDTCFNPGSTGHTVKFPIGFLSPPQRANSMSISCVASGPTSPVG